MSGGLMDSNCVRSGQEEIGCWLLSWKLQPKAAAIPNPPSLVALPPIPMMQCEPYWILSDCSARPSPDESKANGLSCSSVSMVIPIRLADSMSVRWSTVCQIKASISLPAASFDGMVMGKAFNGLARLFPRLFAFQLLVVAEPKVTTYRIIDTAE